MPRLLNLLAAGSRALVLALAVLLTLAVLLLAQAAFPFGVVSTRAAMPHAVDTRNAPRAFNQPSILRLQDSSPAAFAVRDLVCPVPLTGAP